MDRSTIIYLVKEIYEQDENGVFTSTYKKRKVYANVANVKMTEWFEGGRSGLNPQYKITMFSPDYNEEEIVEYKGKQYTVYRTYHTDHGSYGYHQPSKDHIELYVQLKKGNED